MPTAAKHYKPLPERKREGALGPEDRSPTEAELIHAAHKADVTAKKAAKKTTKKGAKK